MSVNIITEWKSTYYIILLNCSLGHQQGRTPRVVAAGIPIVVVRIERARISTIVVVAPAFEPRIVWWGEVSITTLSL